MSVAGSNSDRAIDTALMSARVSRTGASPMAMRLPICVQVVFPGGGLTGSCRLARGRARRRHPSGMTRRPRSRHDRRGLLARVTAGPPTLRRTAGRTSGVRRRHRMVGLLVRALRWRAGSTAAVLVVATVAGLAATLGPLYARSTEESLVLDRVARAGAGTTDVEVTASKVGQPAGYVSQPTELDAIALTDLIDHQLASQTRLDAAFGPVGTWITVPPVVVTAAGQDPGTARTSWHPGACAGVHVVSGRCIAGPDDALVSTGTLVALHLRVGNRLGVALEGPPDPAAAPDPGRDEVTVVGAYDIASADPQVWGSRLPSRYKEPPKGAVEFDEILLDRARIARSA